MREGTGRDKPSTAAFEQRMVEVVVSRASARADLMLDGKAF
jgi:hypothetical protein